MADTLNQEGLAISTLSELVTTLENGFKSIYGSDINVDPDSPDGQIINLFAQAGIDLRELLQDIYTSFDPEQAQGTVLDQRVAINGIERRGGTFTIVPINVTADRTVTLTGLDSLPETLDIPSGVFTVKDDAGTLFVLLTTVTLSSGTTELSFRAAEIGAVTVSSGTINTVVTATAGITGISNTSSVTTQGVNEESDAALRIRRRYSIMNSTEGYLDSIVGSLKNISGVSEAYVYENTLNIEDEDGIPAHGIWCIVADGASADIGQVIYSKRPAGVPMKGSQEVTVARVGGGSFIAKYDRPINQSLWVRFSLNYKNGGFIDPAAIKVQIVDNISFNVGEEPTSDVFTSYVKSLNENYIITGMALSTDNIEWAELVYPTGKNYRFILSTARISIT